MKTLLAITLLLFAIAADAADRSQAEVWRFRKKNPCPSTGKLHGACPDHQVDHVIPLKCGGEDKPRNMQWLTIEEHRAKTKREAKDCRPAK